MFTVDKSIDVDASIEQVFAYLADPTFAPEYMTGSSEVKDIQRLPDGRYTYTEVDKFLGVSMDSRCEQTEVVPNERIVEKWSGTGMDGVVTERLEALEGGKTRVTLHGESSLHAGLLAKLGGPFMERYMNHSVDLAMQAAKAHIEARVGAKSH